MAMIKIPLSDAQLTRLWEEHRISKPKWYFNKFTDCRLIMRKTKNGGPYVACPNEALAVEFKLRWL